MAASTIADPRAWDKAFDNYRMLNRKLDHATPQDARELEVALAGQENELLDSPAPHLGAVIVKLTLLWEGETVGDDQVSEQKRVVINDLENLAAAGREWLGPPLMRLQTLI